MTLDTDKIDDAALALLSLTLHDGDRVWKGIDWEITDRLFAKGLIYDPKNKGKSLSLTPGGVIHQDRTSTISRLYLCCLRPCRRPLDQRQFDAGRSPTGQLWQGTGACTPGVDGRPDAALRFQRQTLAPGNRATRRSGDPDQRALCKLRRRSRDDRTWPTRLGADGHLGRADTDRRQCRSVTALR